MRSFFKVFKPIHALRVSAQILKAIFLVLPLQLLGLVSLAVGLLFIPREAKTLPRVLRWCDNADGDGLCGDDYYQERVRLEGFDPKGYWAKLYWLGCRNPLNYFKHRVLGIKRSAIGETLELISQPHSQGQFVGDYYSGGIRYRENALLRGGRCYEYYWIYPYKLLDKSRCIRARIGWKLGQPEEREKNRDFVSWTCSINLFHSYRGKWPDEKATALEPMPKATHSNFGP